MKDKKAIRQKIAEKKFRRKVRSKIKRKHPRPAPSYSVAQKKPKPPKLIKSPGKGNIWQTIKQAFRRKAIDGKQK